MGKVTVGVALRADCLYTVADGAVAEWLGRGLQNLVQRFNSARCLQENAPACLGFFLGKPHGVFELI